MTGASQTTTAPADTDPVIRVAMIGAGRMAREHLRAFGAAPGVQLAGIFSRGRERAEALAGEFGIKAACVSVRELFEKTQASVAVVTVSVLAVPEITAACCEFPWKILVEKPPGISVEECESLLNTATAKGRDVRVALNRQCMSATQEALAGVNSSSGPRFIKVQDQQPFETMKSSRHPPEVLRRWMYANSIHTIDYFRMFARGALAAVTPVIPWRPEAPGVTVSRLDFDSGDIGLYEGIWHAPGPWAVTVTAPGRRWEMRPLEQAVFQEMGKPPAPLEIHEWDKEFKPGFRRQAQQMIDLARGKACELPSLEDSLKTMRIIDALYPVL